MRLEASARALSMGLYQQPSILICLPELDFLIWLNVAADVVLVP